MGAHSRRPIIRWHGGKWRIARWIIQFFPPHLTYAELFGGGASVMLQKPPSKAELYNDLDETLIALFRVIQDPEQSERLIWLLERTPFSRAEFNLAYEPTPDPVERARRTIIRSFMGFGSDGTAGEYKTGFRRNVTNAAKFPASEWKSYPKALRATVERFRSVVLEQCDAFALLKDIDAPETLFYLDPPYHPETRSQGNRRRGAGYHVYKHELSIEDHERLIDAVHDVEGMVILSGYPHALYDEGLRDWRRVDRKAFADGGRARTECVWINPAAQRRLDASAAHVQQKRLFLEEH